jgi:hypothetical protein
MFVITVLDFFMNYYEEHGELPCPEKSCVIKINFSAISSKNQAISL